MKDTAWLCNDLRRRVGGRNNCKAEERNWLPGFEEQKTGQCGWNSEDHGEDGRGAGQRFRQK